ncbi:MAG: PKD domain-containing protein [Planctomycetes bacterium]|nr:PKD domain-containing protein [Planctomycetota bacterium]
MKSSPTALSAALAAAVSIVTARAQSITEIPHPTVPMSILDMDAAGGTGPVTLAALNAAASPPGGELLGLTLTPGISPDAYDTNTSLGRALASDQAGNPALFDPQTSFYPFAVRFDLPPSTQFGVAIADWLGTVQLTFYSGTSLVATHTSTPYGTADTKFFQLSPGGGFTTFDGVVIADRSYAIPEVAIEIGAASLTADFRTTPSGCNPNSIVLRDASPGGATSWLWDVDNDGTFDYTTQDAVHTYPAPGSYDCRLLVANAVAASVITRRVTVGGGHELATLVAPNNGGSPDGAVYFDLEVRQPISIHGLTTMFAATIGTPVGLDVYTTRDTRHNKEASASAWSLVATDDGTATAAGSTPTQITFAVPLTLQPGRYGVALVAVGAIHQYTNGVGTNQVWSNAALTLRAGAASNVPFSGTPFDPRVWNGSLQYEPTAGFENHGFATPSGAPGVPPPSLTTIALPRVGQIAVLSMVQHDPSALGFVSVGFGRGPQIVPWGVYNMGIEVLGVLIAAPMPIATPQAFAVAIPNGCSLRGVALNFVHSNIVPSSPNFLSMSNGCEWFVH